MNKLPMLVILLFLLSSSLAQSQTYQNVPVFLRYNVDNTNLEENKEIFRVRNAWLNRLGDGRYENVKITIPDIEGSLTLESCHRKRLHQMKGLN